MMEKNTGAGYYVLPANWRDIIAFRTCDVTIKFATINIELLFFPWPPCFPVFYFTARRFKESTRWHSQKRAFRSHFKHAKRGKAILSLASLLRARGAPFFNGVVFSSALCRLHVHAIHWSFNSPPKHDYYRERKLF